MGGARFSLGRIQRQTALLLERLALQGNGLRNRRAAEEISSVEYEDFTEPEKAERVRQGARTNSPQGRDPRTLQPAERPTPDYGPSTTSTPSALIRNFLPGGGAGTERMRPAFTN
jgi:hypothetical protein